MESVWCNIFIHQPLLFFYIPNRLVFNHVDRLILQLKTSTTLEQPEMFRKYDQYRRSFIRTLPESQLEYHSELKGIISRCCIL